MKCKNKTFTVPGTVYVDPVRKMQMKELEVIITNDEKGKTLSINNGIIQFSVPADGIAKYLN